MTRPALKLTKGRLLAAVLVVIGIAVLLLTRGSSDTNKTQATLAPLVTVVPAQRRDIVETASVTGTLVPYDEILVTPEVDGYSIIEVLVDEGMRVEKGQVLARLSRGIIDTQITQLNATIDQARNQIVQAEAANVEAQLALQRTQALSRSGNATEVQLEQRQSTARAAEGRLAAARNGLAIAEAQRAELQVKLERTDIKAPEEGVISRKTARIGAVVSAVNEPLFRIIAHGRIELEAEVTEYQLPRLHVGAPAVVSIEAQQKVKGEVRLISPEVDRKTRLGKVRIAVQPDARLRIGAFAAATIELARQTGIAVPTTSVIYGAEGPSLQVVIDNRIRTKSIQIGLTGDGFVQVLGDLHEGDKVVARAGSFLQDGDSVREFQPSDKSSDKTTPGDR